MAGRPRRWLRLLVVLVAALLLVVGAAAVTSQTAWFRDWLRAEILRRTAEAFHGRLAIGRLDGDLLSRVALRDVTLTLDDRSVVALAHAEATYDVWGMLLGGGVRLDTLVVDGLDLRLVERAGVWNLARALESPTPRPEEPSTTRFAIDALTIRNARVRVERAGERWDVRPARLAGSLATGPEGTRITLTEAALALPHRHVAVSELAGTVTFGHDGRIAIQRLRLRTARSRVEGDVAIAAAGADYDVHVETALDAGELRRLVRSDVPRTDLAARLSARGPAARVALAADAQAGTATATLAGSVDLAAPRLGYDVTVDAKHLDAAALLGPGHPATDLTGSVRAEGRGTTLAEMATHVVLALHDSTIAGKPLAAVAVDATVDAGTVRFESSARTDAGRAEARGTVAPGAERYDVTLTADRFDPATLLGDPMLAGSVAGTVQIVGTGFTPATANAKASLSLAPSRVGGVVLDSARADLGTAAGRVTVERLVLTGPALAVEAHGEIVLGDAPAASTGRLAFDATTRDLGALAALAGVRDVTGTLGVRGSASGRLDALALSADVTGREVAQGANRAERVTVKVAGSDLGGPGARATVTGILAGVAAGGQRFPRANVDASWGRTGKDTATARIALDALDARDRRDVLVAEAAITPTAARVEVAAFTLALGDDVWRVDGRPVLVVRDGGGVTDGLVLRSRDASVRVAGAARATGASDLRIGVDRLDLSSLHEPRAPDAKDTRIAGVLAGEAALTGTLANPRLILDASLANLRIAGVRYAGASGHVEATATRATVAARLVQEGGRTLALDVASPIDLSLSPVRFRATGDLSGTLAADHIDLAFVGALTPALEDVRGVLDADVALGGTLDRLALRGPVTITGGHARVPASGITYDAIEAALRLEGQAASVERLHLAAGDGTLDGSGDVRLGAAGPELDVRVQLVRFPLFDNHDGRGSASGWVWASGTLAAPVVEGALETDRLVLQVPDKLAGEVRPPDPTIEVIGPHAPPVRPVAAADVAAPTPGLFDRAAITIQLRVPRNAWIRRSDAEIELRGWMTAWKKPDAELQLSGRIEVVRGWFAFQGKTFDVSEGEVLFTGAGLNPTLRVIAQQRVGDYVARVVLGGTLEKPTLTLESEPALPQADVLSLLVFGKPASELSSGESVGLREQALGVAAGYAASELRQSVAKALGVDTLEFSGGSDLSRAQVSAGKYVAPDVFVSLSHRFGEAVQELRIQYYLTPRWTIETSTDTLGRSAVDVFWRRRY